MKFLNNINAKRKLKSMNDALNQVFLSKSNEELSIALEHALKIHNSVENDMDESYLFPEEDEEKQIFAKNVWLNLDSIKFLNHYSGSVIADTLIYSIGSFYIQQDKHIKMMFANFVLDGLLMAKNHYKDNWKEYISRYFDIQSNITSFIEKNTHLHNWQLKANHPFNYQYPSYYLFTALKENIPNSEKLSISHYDRALIKLALLNQNNPEDAKKFIQQAIDIFGAATVLNGEEQVFASPLNSLLYENDVDRLKDYSFITNTIEKLNLNNFNDILG